MHSRKEKDDGEEEGKARVIKYLHKIHSNKGLVSRNVTHPTTRLTSA